MPSAACRAVDDAAAHLHPEMQRQACDESGAVTYLVRGDQIRSVNSALRLHIDVVHDLMKVRSVEAAGFPLDTPPSSPDSPGDTQRRHPHQYD